MKTFQRGDIVYQPVKGFEVDLIGVVTRMELDDRGWKVWGFWSSGRSDGKVETSELWTDPEVLELLGSVTDLGVEF